MKKIAVIPIRDDSTRLERKATGFKLYKNFTPIECIMKRLELSKRLDDIIFISPATAINKSIEKICKKNGYKYYAGSTNDISRRALEAVEYSDCCMVDITGDCPLVDPLQVDRLLFEYERNKKDGEYLYITNILTRSYPDGFDIQVFDSKLLELARNISIDKKEITNYGWDIMHYSGYINACFRILNFPASEEYWFPRWGLTLDYQDDVFLLQKVYQHFDNFKFTCEDVIEFIKKNENILKINEECERKISGE